MDHGIDKHTHDYTLLHIHVRRMIRLLHYKCTHLQQINVLFQLFIT
jgi:hypothetical protein